VPRVLFIRFVTVWSHFYFTSHMCLIGCYWDSWEEVQSWNLLKPTFIASFFDPMPFELNKLMLWFSNLGMVAIWDVRLWGLIFN
jgi:hypothetical protein